MNEWLSMPQAVEKYGYSNANSLRRRLRQLRELGQVEDLGAPPEEIRAGGKGPVRILWANPKSMMLGADAPAELLNPKVGRR